MVRVGEESRMENGECSLFWFMFTYDVQYCSTVQTDVQACLPSHYVQYFRPSFLPTVCLSVLRVRVFNS